MWKVLFRLNPPPLHGSCAERCRELVEWRGGGGGGGVLSDGKHWVVREVSPPSSFFFFFPPVFGLSEPAESGRAPLQVLSSLSRGHVEVLGRFIGVIDGQADGSDVL